MPQIFIVDDSISVRKALEITFKRHSLDSFSAISAEQALETLAGDPHFDLMMADVIMPGMSGIEFGELVRKRYPSLPVVLTSGYNEVMAERGRHGFELIQKPYVSDTLVRVFRKTMAENMAAGRKAS